MCRKIMVVEQESSIREALSKILNEENYEVLSAASGPEAVASFRTDRIDLLLLDLGLPVKDGRQLVEWLREVDPLPPLVIITAGNNQQQLAEDAGADVSMQKPLNVPLLLDTIRDLIDERRAGQFPDITRRPRDLGRRTDGGGQPRTHPPTTMGKPPPALELKSR